MLYVYRMLTNGLYQLPRCFLVWYRDQVALWRSRQDLRDLDDRQLADIGVTRAQAKREADRPFGKDTAPWATGAPTLHGDPYLAGRPVTAMRSFYRSRGRTELPEQL